MVKTFPFLATSQDFYFDGSKAQRVIDFIERFCRLSDPMGQPFVLLPWQKQIVLDVFGWYRKDNNERRFNSVYIEVPRKQGKSYFVAALLIYLLIADGVSGSEVYATACSREQSGILFKSVSRMVYQSKFLSERLTPLLYKSEWKYNRGDSILKALSGENVGSHGKYPTAVAVDECHEWTSAKSESLYEALTSGFGNRASPLVLHITTAGFGSQPTLAHRLHDKAIQFGQGEGTDPTFYGVIYGAALEDDWTSEETWKKANPSWELAKKNLRREFAAAKTEPSKENTFRRLFLNQWTQQNQRWLNMEQWDSCVSDISYESFKGQDIICGLDLSQIYDLTALAILYPLPDKWRLFVKCFMPSQQIERRSKEDNIPYDQWAKAGFLIPTQGISNGLTIDYQTIVQHITKVAEENNIISLGYDPSNAVTVIPQLENIGINCLPIYQTFNELSPATNEFERRLVGQEIEIAVDPCLRFQAGNVELAFNQQGQCRPTKPNAKGKYSGKAVFKVDALIASIIATQAALLTLGREEEKKTEDKAKVYFV